MVGENICQKFSWDVHKGTHYLLFEVPKLHYYPGSTIVSNHRNQQTGKYIENTFKEKRIRKKKGIFLHKINLNSK